MHDEADRERRRIAAIGRVAGPPLPKSPQVCDCVHFVVALNPMAHRQRGERTPAPQPRIVTYRLGPIKQNGAVNTNWKRDIGLERTDHSPNVPLDTSMQFDKGLLEYLLSRR